MGIFYHFKSPFIASTQVNFGLPLSLFTLLSWLRIPLCTGASGGLRWTCPNHLNRCWTNFLQLMLPLIYHVYHRSELDPFLYDRKSNATYAFPRHLAVEHVVFSHYRTYISYKLLSQFTKEQDYLYISKSQIILSLALLISREDRIGGSNRGLSCQNNLRTRINLIFILIWSQ